MGKALRDGYRQKIFLMTKLDGRDKKTAAIQLDESLKRLQTDVIDLVDVDRNRHLARTKEVAHHYKGGRQIESSWIRAVLLRRPIRSVSSANGHVADDDEWQAREEHVRV